MNAALLDDVFLKVLEKCVGKIDSDLLAATFPTLA